MLRVLTFGLLMLAGATAPAAAQNLASELVARSSTFHPFRDLATELTQGVIPPKGCTPLVIRQAAANGIAPDLTGCEPSMVEGPIRMFLRMTPEVSPAEGTVAGALVVDQSPKPGQAVAKGGTFELMLPRPPVKQPVDQPSSDPSSPTNGHKTASVDQADQNVPVTLICPKGWVRTSESSCVPLRSPWRRLADWFWDGLNPLWAPGLPLAAALAWRLFAPRPTMLPGTPTVDIELRQLRPAIRFEQPTHAVRHMLAVDLVMRPSAPAVDPHLTVSAERIAP